jgi:glycerophosphoryl diester phosphodiesterase
MNWTTPGVGLRIGGHRGAAGEAPENTFAGFDRAAVANVDYLELDVQLALDGIPVVYHDEDLDRTSDGSGSLAVRSSADLLRLDAGAWFHPRFRGKPIAVDTNWPMLTVPARDALRSDVTGSRRT